MNNIFLGLLVLILPKGCQLECEVITKELELDSYYVTSKKIDRRAILINEKYCFHSYMIKYNRRQKMDSLYFFETPFYLTKEDSILTLRNSKSEIKLLLHYNQRAY